MLINNTYFSNKIELKEEKMVIMVVNIVASLNIFAIICIANPNDYYRIIYSIARRTRLHNANMSILNSTYYNAYFYTYFYFQVFQNISKLHS